MTKNSHLALTIIDSGNLSDVAYQRIKQDVLRCVFMPGDSVTEAQLTARYDMGKAPIRHALTRLSQEGLIQTERRKGYRISPVTLSDIQDVFQLRMMLEPEAARLAAGRLSEEQVITLRATCEIEYEPADRDSEDNFLQANRLFHVTIAEASGNSRLVQWICQLLDDVERILHLGLAREPRGHQFQGEHLDLLRALLANQPEQAAEMVRRQIQGGLDMVVAGIVDNPDRLKSHADNP